MKVSVGVDEGVIVTLGVYVMEGVIVAEGMKGRFPAGMLQATKKSIKPQHRVINTAFGKSILSNIFHLAF